MNKNMENGKIKGGKVLDGINDTKAFATCKVKILWILKEADKSNRNESWDHRAFHKNVSQYKYWKATYKRIIYVSYGIIKRKLSWSKLPWIDEDATIENVNILDYIAIINVNKNGGGASSINRVISKIYLKNKNRLLLQISKINPDIIINASRVSQLYDDLSKKYKMKDEKKLIRNNENILKYSYNKKKLIINFYHPGVRRKGITDEVYCNKLLYVFKKWSQLTLAST